MPDNHFMPVADIAKTLNLRENLLYGWAASDKVPKKKDSNGIMLLSLDGVRKHHKARLTKKHLVKPKPAVRKKRPATKQADHLTKMAAVLEIFFPQGIPVKQYTNALLFVEALNAVVPK